MPSDPLKIAIKGSTQDNLPIEDIVDGIVILKDGSASMVLQVSSVNFDLLSEREQGALVFAYGGILNSLNFPIQIVISSTTKDVGNYLNNLELAKNSQQNEKLKERIASYKKFVEETVKRNDVLSKTFYIVIPFSSLELGIKNAQKQIFNSLNPIKKEVELPFSKEYIVEKAKASLQPKEDHLVRLFSRLGLEIKALNTKELIELFYKIYNEDTSNNQKLQSVNYTAAAVTGK
ncbi:MAG: hypothetical protein US68_C0004G0002 [Candidatus Shapirobacteria bacterium GW2011_GWE1_38_10]|uniref:TraC-like domain-containing protein n=1 Tax=Candidatus Shapirobacteria bacterium GW2011_GWE1_38_10 TaxID=1618488 RepID=A0A0G0IHL7_9BACT|nr:MAG: hypothetical protein US46_C0005G0018 [Candidatus Shapirobacteria bacterium GW2011_GWF2_37_20]KKQ50520.1 MAG: hypothetical protein US68_C0004G0002 [Candidatus Shapirobacteria bacterium GW2011_GWE1_38_10]KKQ64660.1 MAG: hypothetical protein US85_C0005G0008 [Candidatus Shapirobacteria bacterium GW2011_GWF1_38_23]HBP51606.1 hypothetical protein [Candidatus Shapirobacteria bacterium]